MKDLKMRWKREGYLDIRVFNDKNVDVIFTVGEPNSNALKSHDKTICGYIEHIPITVSAIDKTGITGTKLKWKGEAELRRIDETYPLGSIRLLEKRRDQDKILGSTIMYSTEWILTYRRDTT
jgi:hypothetical protein